MTSSMLTGEKRRVSSRRGGLTSLGKVVVPKPINLPSQRLENNGLTRNVDIVPKGSLSWGNRSSNSSSNPWGSTTLSPTADGGSASPSHPSGRPSSGGTGTRPSTAGSDRSHEPTNNVWGPNSRPSSASGALTSNHISLISLRPQSAETRPGSSQLSRFAESPDNSMAWSIPGTAEKLGAPVLKNDGFSLLSGEFPTLGSGKDNDAKNAEQEGSIHCRPGSASSAVQKSEVTADSRSGNFNSWRKDDFPHDGFRPNVESWQGEPRSFHGPNMLPQPFAPWHTNPSPGGVWYRGPPTGPPPYGTPVGPGWFPMEYPYHHAQVPGAVTKTGDMYRPHTPNTCIRPGMPNRPAFYPTPVPYEGYFGPPMGNRSLNEQDIRFMGIAPGPGVYNGYVRQTADGQMWEQAAPASASCFEKWDQPRAIPGENNWRPDHKKDEHLDSRRVAVGEEFSPQSFDKVNTVNEIVVSEADIGVCASPEILEAPKDTTLLQKIEVLNAKARASNGKHDVTYVSGGDEQQIKLQAVNEDEGSEAAAAASGSSFPRKANLGKGRFNAQEAEGWQKKALNTETTNVHWQDRRTSVGFAEKSGSFLEGKDDPSDIQAQRARMREKAKQRAEQLQKEEEERTREQRAKCLAKLEELNRRSLAVQVSSQESENALPCEPIIATTMVEAPNPALTINTHVADHTSVGCSDRATESAILSKELQNEVLIDTDQLTVVIQNSSPLNDDVDSFDPAAGIGPLSKKKEMSYKEMQNTPLENRPTEKPASSTNEAPKMNTESEMKVTPYTEVEIVSEVASSREPSIDVLPNVLHEPSVHQKGKKYKSGKSRNKQEETPSIVIVPENTNTAMSSVESSKQKPSEWDLDPNPVKPITSIKDAGQSIKSHGRVNNQWKSQNQRRLPRSQQANRSVDTNKGNGAVVWAPVRLPNKNEMNDEPSNKILDQETALTTRSDNPVQNNLKSTRAEMEGGVPKPVSNESPRQISIQQPIFPSSYKTLSDETVGRVQSNAHNAGNTQHAEIVIGKVVISTAPMNRDNKQVKTHGLRCLPGSTESTHMQVVQDEFSFSSKPNKSVQEEPEHVQNMKPDVQLVKEDQIKYSDGWNNPDEWNVPDNSNTAASVSSLVKNQRFRGKEKRQPYKGYVSTGSNSNFELHQKNTSSGNKDKVFSQSSALEVNETDQAVPLKDGSVVAEHSTSHWQPKSQTYPSHNQRGGRPIGGRPVGGQDVTADVRDKKESVPKDGEVPNAWHQVAKREKRAHSLKGRPYSPSSKIEEIGGGEAPSLGPQDSKREKKAPSMKGPHLPDNGSLELADFPSNEVFGSRHEQQRISSGFHKNGNQNNRYGRGNEYQRDWNSSGQDNKQQHQLENQARQTHNAGSYNSSKPNNFEGPMDGPNSSRFRERGQHYLRRGTGNSYGRQSGTVRVDATYD